MAIFQSLAAFGVGQLVSGALSTVGLSGGGEAVVALLAARFTDHSRKLTEALKVANDRAWKALEIALAGDSFWDRCKVVLASGDDKAFREQVRSFLDSYALSGDSTRGVCLQELRAARKNKVLSGGALDPKALAQQAGAFAGFAEPQALLDAEWRAVDGMAAELRGAGYANLARLLSTRPPQGLPLLVVAVRYFFRRQVETDPELFHGLAFAKLEQLSQTQDAGFAALDAALTQQGQRLDALLGEIQTVVVETHGAVLGLQEQIEDQSEQVRQIGRDVAKLLEQHQLQRRELRPGDSLSIRNDNERQLVKQLVARYRALPEGERKEVPSLLNAIGKLEVVAGDFDAAQKDFKTVALLEQDNHGKAEGHYNAYLVSLEKRDWTAALQELNKAVRLDAKRFAPFPVGKYHPLRILGAGGFGVAFLCKHKYMDAQVVVKTLALEELGRGADKVFTEAQVLRQLDHPAIIRISECDYVDGAKKPRPYLLMDYFQGGTLEEYVKSNGPMDVDDLIAVARHVADGLNAAHAKGILHRDVKPANLLLRREDYAWKVKIIDFGLALRQKVVQKSASTSKQGKTLIGDSIAGTIDYAAPEQMGKREGVAPGPYSDVYGWAKTCCFALFLTPQPLMRHWKSIPPALAELLERCLDEDPKRRPQGFMGVLAVLDKITRQAAAPRPAAAKIPFVEAVEGAPRRRRPAPPPQRIRVMPLLLIGGIVLMFLLCAGGSALLATLRSPTVLRPVPPPNVAMPFNPFPQTNAAPTDVKQALEWLKSGDMIRKNAAADWLAKTPVDEAHRQEVGEALLKEVNSDVFLWIGNKDGGAPADALVKLHYEPAAAAFARRLPDNPQGAARRLAQLGPSTEKEVLKYMDHPRAEVRTQVDALLRDFHTTPEAMLDQAVADLRTSDPATARAACDFLAKTPALAAKKPDVSQALESPLNDGKGDMRDAAAKALKTWGTADNVPSLINLLDSEPPFHPHFIAAVDALAALKDEKGAEAVAHYLPDHFHNQDAERALRAMGPIAETAVSAYQNSADNNVRQRARSLLQGYGAKPEVTINARVADLDSPDRGQRKEACEWFASHPVVEAKQKEVARGLDRCLADASPFNDVRQAAANAEAVWGDKESVPALLAAMKKDRGNVWQQCVDALVALKAERAVVPLILETQNPIHKAAAQNALREMGPLVEMALDNIVADPQATAADRITACQLLGDPKVGIGTAKSIPALTAAAKDDNANVKQVAAAALAAMKR